MELGVQCDYYFHFVTLLLLEYSKHINKHIRNKYLDPKDPRKLGGRAAGPQGMVGSTDGVERRNREWKNSLAEQLSNDKNIFCASLKVSLNRRCT